MPSCSVRSMIPVFPSAEYWHTRKALCQSDGTTRVKMFQRSNSRFLGIKEFNNRTTRHNASELHVLRISCLITCSRREQRHTWKSHTNHMEFELIESGLLIFLCLFVCLFICFFCSVHVDGLGEGSSRIIVHFLLRSAALPQTGNATDRETGTHGRMWTKTDKQRD